MDTSARLLRLLSLLQTHRDWSGAELADRLRVTTRTVRRDVERLRELGYPVHAARGTAGYRLGPGSSLPPLLLDDEEATAVVVGLRTTSGSVTGIEEAALRALLKIEQVLPARLRHRVDTLHRTTVRIGPDAVEVVDADVLMAVAEACRRHEQLRFDYTGHAGSTSRRTVEPHSLVSFQRRWYLVAWDLDRDDWRSFRVDRLRPRTPTGPRFTPRPAPDGDVGAYLARRLSSDSWPYRAVVLLHGSADELAERVWPGTGVLEPVDERSCRLHVGADSPWALSWMITSVGAGFTVLEGPPELLREIRLVAERCAAAVP
ncbi:MAG TPA: WYL domain-containing protein [Microlunatus sp.]|nr:WYL domain-containing protein [Microlunatus sp.]